MTEQQIAEVWGMVDRDSLAVLARGGPEPVFATISGAHLYGFASRDSDVDLRGAFLLPARSLLSLRPPASTLAVTDHTGPEIDWVAHDIGKFARLMIRHNGYVLEQLFSPLVVVATEAFQKLRQLAVGCLTRPTVRHYQGFARGRRQRLHQPGATVKHFLYAYRVLMTGIHLMRAGTIESNLVVLNESFRCAPIDELIRRKREGIEAEPVDPSEVARHDDLLDALELQLVAAHATSRLPLHPTTIEEIEEFVVRLRLDGMNAS